MSAHFLDGVCQQPPADANVRMISDDAFGAIVARNASYEVAVQSICVHGMGSHLSEHVRRTVWSYLADPNEIVIVRNSADLVYDLNEHTATSEVYVEFISLQTGRVSRTSTMTLDEEQIYELHCLLQGPSVAHSGSPLGDQLQWDIIGEIAEPHLFPFHRWLHCAEPGLPNKESINGILKVCSPPESLRTVKFLSGGRKPNGDPWDYEWLAAASIEQGWVAQVQDRGRYGLCTLYDLATCRSFGQYPCTGEAWERTVLTHQNVLVVCSATRVEFMVVSKACKPSITKVSQIEVTDLVHYGMVYPSDLSYTPLAIHEGCFAALCGPEDNPVQLKIFALSDSLALSLQAVLNPFRLQCFGSVALTSDKIITVEYSLNNCHPINAMEIVVRNVGDPKSAPMLVFTERTPMPYSPPRIYCQAGLGKRARTFLAQRLAAVDDFSASDEVPADVK